MKTIIITCDECGRHLTESGNSVDYRIALCSERIPSCDGVVTDMNIEPDFPQALHFCGMRCFLGYIKREFHLESVPQ